MESFTSDLAKGWFHSVDLNIELIVQCTEKFTQGMTALLDLL